MAGEMVVFDAIQHSNLPNNTKSMLRTWLERSTGRDLTPGTAAEMATSAVYELGRNIRQSGEGGLMGFGLGALHAKLKTGLDVKGVPVDGVVGAGGSLLSVIASAMGAGEIAPELRNLGATGFTVLGFRKGYDVVAEIQLRNGGVVGGTFGPSQKAKVHGEFGDMGTEDSDIGEDPIAVAARALG